MSTTTTVNPGNSVDREPALALKTAIETGTGLDLELGTQTEPEIAIGGGLRARRRSKAWVYYAILAGLSLVGVFAGKPAGLLVFALCGLYSRYLYRGGRVVFWIW